MIIDIYIYILYKKKHPKKWNSFKFFTSLEGFAFSILFCGLL